MGKYQEEKKTPIIMVKKRRTLLPLPYLKKQVLSHVQRQKRWKNQSLRGSVRLPSILIP